MGNYKNENLFSNILVPSLRRRLRSGLCDGKGEFLKNSYLQKVIFVIPPFHEIAILLVPDMFFLKLSLISLQTKILIERKHVSRYYFM